MTLKMSKNSPSVRSIYRKRAIAIIVSAIITIMMQMTLYVPIKSDTKSSEAATTEISVHKKKLISLSNSLTAFAAGPKESVLPMMTMKTTTTTVTTSTSTTTTTTATTTSTTTTTSLTTTTETTTTEEVVLEEVESEDVPVEVEEEIYVEEATEPSTEEPYIYCDEYGVYVPEYGAYDIEDYIEEPAISDSDYILLCNALGHEYGSNTVSVQEKAKVIETIMNRVNSPLYPNTIYGVLTQTGQFSGAWSYVNLTSFSSEVTESVKQAVTYYFEHTDEYQHGYLSFYGDGRWNYFS